MVVIDQTEADILAEIKLDFPTAAFADRKYLPLWLQYKARAVPRLVRSVKYSERILPLTNKFPAIKKIAELLKSGGDVQPFLSERIYRLKSKPSADPLFADWQISHFHLGRVYKNGKIVQDSNDLLFAYIIENEALFLDVGVHCDWANEDMLRALGEISPEYLERYRIKGIVGTTGQRKKEDRIELRKCGMDSIIDLDGKYYFAPGGGLTSAKIGSRFAELTNEIRRTITKLVEDFQKDHIHPEVLKFIGSDIGIPIRLGLWYRNGRIEIVDRQRNLVFWQSSILS